MRYPALLAVFACACTPAPFVVLEYPDAQAESDAAELTAAALEPTTDCGPLMRDGQLQTWVLSVTDRLPLATATHLGKLARGPAVFYAEIRDSAGLPFLRGCQKLSSGGEVVVTLQRVLKPLHVKESEQLTVPLTTLDWNRNAMKFAPDDLPPFAKYDPAARMLRLAPGPADQGTYTVLFHPTEDVPGAFTLRASITVEDVGRSLKWDRIYRGWYGRFDAAALWDPDHNQLFTTGGRDMGVDLAMSSKTLYSSSLPPDVLTDYRVLQFPTDGGTGDWGRGSVTRVSTSGKFGHAMGYVRTPGGMKLGFVIGGSDGSQLSPESLLFAPQPLVSQFASPSALNDPTGASFHIGMAAAVEPDSSATYLFGGDLGQTAYSNDVLKVTVESDTTLKIEKLDIELVPRPSPRSNAGLVLAQSPKRLVVIGGRNIGASPELFKDAWVLCLEVLPPKCPLRPKLQWMPVVPSGDTFPGAGSPGIFALAAGYDAPRDRVLTYGGLGVSGNPPNSYLYEDVFSLDLAGSVVDAGQVAVNFTKLPPPGGPLGLVGAAVTQDYAGERLLMYGGITGRVVDGKALPDLLEDVWQLGLTPGNERMTRLAVKGVPAAPSRRLAGSILPRPMLLLGGEGEGVQPLDEWLVNSDGGVRQVVTPGDTPLPRANMGVVYNSDLDEYWLYGGRVKMQLPQAELFRYRADAGFSALVHDDALGDPYDPRWGQAMVYDQRNHRMVVFAGTGLHEGISGTLTDLFALSVQNGTLVTTPIVASGEAPDPRYGSIAGYDRAGQRMLMFGGTATKSGGSAVDTNEVWELSLIPGQERWQALETTGMTPEAMFLPAGAWSSENPPHLYVIGTVKRMGLLGDELAFVDELWRLSLEPTPTWTKLSKIDFRPRPRVFPGCAYDDANNRILITGGAADPVFRHDVWSLTIP